MKARRSNLKHGPDDELRVRVMKLIHGAPPMVWSALTVSDALDLSRGSAGRGTVSRLLAGLADLHILDRSVTGSREASYRVHRQDGKISDVSLGALARQIDWLKSPHRANGASPSPDITPRAGGAVYARLSALEAWAEKVGKLTGISFGREG